MTDNLRLLRAEKAQARSRMWSILDAEQVSAPMHSVGRIPRFAEAEAAADRLAATEAWARAQVIKVNPDTAQLPVRIRAIEDGKLLYMAVPYLRSEYPFYVIDPARGRDAAVESVTIEGAARHAPGVDIADMRRLDLVVSGSVAVNRTGARLGKGGGYSDIELALLVEAGAVHADTILATTVHELQVVDDALPETEHDFRVGVIATPTELIDCPPSRRPGGLFLHHLTAAQVDAIPVLRDRIG